MNIVNKLWQGKHFLLFKIKLLGDGWVLINMRVSHTYLYVPTTPMKEKKYFRFTRRSPPSSHNGVGRGATSHVRGREGYPRWANNFL